MAGRAGRGDEGASWGGDGGVGRSGGGGSDRGGDDGGGGGEEEDCAGEAIPSGKVERVRAQWSVHEDGALAYHLQVGKGEIRLSYK